MDSREHLENQLHRHEGFRSKPYLDTVGVWTVGWGHNLNKGISRIAAGVIFQEDLEEARMIAVGLPAWGCCNPARQNVLVNMAFNLGNRIRSFTRMLAAIEAGDFEGASHQMLASKWADQVGGRAKELAEQMRTGQMT